MQYLAFLKNIRSASLLGGLLVSIATLAAAPSSTHASPYRTSLTGNNRDLRMVASELHDGVKRRGTPKLFNHNKVLKFSTAVQGVGRFKITLNDFQFKSWDARFESVAGFSLPDDKDVVLVTGTAVSNGKELPVGGGIYKERQNGKMVPVLHLVLNSERSKGRSVYLKGIVSGQSVSEVKISSVPATRLKALACGNEDEHEGTAGKTSSHHTASLSVAEDNTDGTSTPSTNAAVTPVSPSNPKVATLGTEFDYKFYQSYGDSSNAQIATLVAAASAIYQRQMGIRLQIKAQHGFTTAASNPFTSNDANNILTTFRSYSLSNNQLGDADIYHLFSGEDFAGSTIGLAWVGVTCSVQDYSFGITQKFNPSADASITAHEIGHNLGASHDTNDSASIMAAYVNVPGSTYFSQTSIDQINAHLNASPECMDADTNPQPTPAPTAVPSTPAPTVAVPDPTATPAATATPSVPTAVPGIGLSVSATRAGLVTIRIALASADDSSCRVVLFGAAKKDAIGSEIYRFTPEAAVTVLRFANVKRVGIPKVPYLAFTAKNICPNGITWSSTQNLLLSSISKRAPASTTASRVLSQFKSALAALRRQAQVR